MRVEYERVYIPGGEVAHLSSQDRSTLARTFTECGLWWPGAGFFGTGSQEEYEEAARRRLCLKCQRATGVTE